jgi:hypothetical protein
MSETITNSNDVIVTLCSRCIVMSKGQKRRRQCCYLFQRFFCCFDQKEIGSKGGMFIVFCNDI